YLSFYCLFFFLPIPATTEIYTLSLHDALPIWPPQRLLRRCGKRTGAGHAAGGHVVPDIPHLQGWPAGGPPSGRDFRSEAAGKDRSEEHTSELQSRGHLVCRLLLEKKKDARNAG